MLIYTLQFPQVELKNRMAFLDFVQQNVIALALKNEASFLENGVSTIYFHKKKQHKGFVPIRIHSIMQNGLFTVRAYGEEAVNSLRFWLPLFLDKFPDYSEHIIENLEHWELKKSEHPLYYQSENWIPFNDCAEKDGCFYDNEYPEQQIATALQSRLTGNLRTFFSSIGIDNSTIDTQIILLEYPEKAQQVIALKTKVNGKLKEIPKKSFRVKVKTNVVLPMCFSLGQNVAYGNGIFGRIMT